MKQVFSGWKKAVVALLAIGALTSAFNVYGGKKMFQKNNDTHQEALVMHRIGRFEINIPSLMKRTSQEYSIQFSEIKEVPWPLGLERERARTDIWNQRLEKLKKSPVPLGEQSVILEIKDFSSNGVWMKGVKQANPPGIIWNIFLDQGNIGVWFTKRSSKVNAQGALEDLMELVHAYRGANEGKGTESRFHLEHGAIALPYFEQEDSDVYFKGGPLDLKFRIKMRSTDDVEKVGLLKRLSEMLLGGLASGLSIDKLRTGKRVVAGLRGEEILLRMTEGDNTSNLSFSWQYPGEEDSGDHPDILLDMESEDGQVKEKMAVWDQILDSMKLIK